MGKRLRQQRRGKGSPTFTGSKGGRADVSYIAIDDKQKEDVLKGKVIDIVSDPVRTAALAEILFENGEREFVIAAEGMRVGQEVEYGRNAKLEIGNTLPLSNINEGCPIFNIEKYPGDGGRFVKTSGIYAWIITKDINGVSVRMPSGKNAILNPDSRATIGNISCGGRIEKPFVKAGKKYHAMKATHKHYPGLRGVAMNAVSHPFGGSQHHAGKSKSVSRHSAPGQKVGAIASKRTGRKKK